MKHLIINADDFGYSKAVNLGIMESHINGVLTSTTLMANMPGVDHAVSLLKNMPNLCVGAHLTLTCGKPMLGEKVSTLIKENGYFFKLEDMENKVVQMDTSEIYEEWKTQIRYLLKKGVNLSHIDSHHHVHTFKEHEEIIKVLSEEFNLPVRNCNNVLENKIRFLDLCNYNPIRNMEEKYENVRIECFKVIEKIIKKNIQYENTEAMCHPAFLDSYLLENSSFNIARIREVDILCDQLMRDLINKYEIKLCNYKNI
ncbi:carbohydrate deacetylase [Clostridium butyricum]|uniref:YdjC family protein n=1 Tax=Clostridium butyricum E4 str. BoNT E BL5262 TaxID=632245 RepID=C4ICA9_CLOBU|nr:carbohydrate deacetylase [Clostridium butyricum]APF21273.1 ydjC-like family protein [Clostridium butyricum]EDT76177.1 ydjC-like protein [Clostridium butyricum 5521]EEP56230.1 YdjC family protein [Clostridium butyricum E4 str. BoNT E BL5262]NFL30034.1 carbohydrate deacetylase [Clostridium butyricum]NFS16623.1 carbohydrate deacetylase [Clostridium butyricum]